MAVVHAVDHVAQSQQHRRQPQQRDALLRSRQRPSPVCVWQSVYRLLHTTMHSRIPPGLQCNDRGGNIPPAECDLRWLKDYSSQPLARCQDGRLRSFSRGAGTLGLNLWQVMMHFEATTCCGGRSSQPSLTAARALPTAPPSSVPDLLTLPSTPLPATASARSPLLH